VPEDEEVGRTLASDGQDKWRRQEWAWRYTGGGMPGPLGSPLNTT
jgi:hypothetical protein